MLVNTRPRKLVALQFYTADFGDQQWCIGNARLSPQVGGSYPVFEEIPKTLDGSMPDVNMTDRKMLEK